MKEMTFEQMEEIEGGSFAKTCVILAGGTVVYGLGLALNWWNPIGWVSAAAIAADAVCLAYAAANV